MKTLFLLAAMIGATITGKRPGAFQTANAAADTAQADAPTVESLQARLDAQEAELAKLRGQRETQPSSSTALLCKGAGVDPENVNWRIAAGLSPAHAVEVALREKLEAEAEAESAKKKKR